MRILVVDDYVDNALLLARVLEQRGHVVRTAFTLDEARTTCAELGSVDLIIADIDLPDGDGCALARLAKEHGGDSIAVTGYGMPDELDRCRSAGFAAQLVKPLQIEELDAALAGIAG